MEDAVTERILTRTCAHCSESKSIRGIWYLVDHHDATPAGAFWCESCYGRAVAPDRAPRLSPEAVAPSGLPAPGEARFGF